jgi:hypothetical protein
MAAAPRQWTEEMKLEALNALDPTADRAVQKKVLEEALADKHFRVVAKAAALAVDALAVYERNTKLHERVQAALAKRSDG